MSVGRLLQVIGLLAVGSGLMFGLYWHGYARAEWVELSGLLLGVVVFVAGHLLDRRRMR
ncbi:MAG: hypothetical protein U1E76_07430 [Planctomycetota bacterium]